MSRAHTGPLGIRGPSLFARLQSLPSLVTFHLPWAGPQLLRFLQSAGLARAAEMINICAS